MWAFVGLTITLFVGLAVFSGYMKRDEIMANWSKYKSDPLYMFAAPMFKPSDDPRSRLKFATDNFYENVMELLNSVFLVFLEPVFKMFKLFTESLVQTSEGLFNIKAILGNSWNKFNQMTDVFMRRFQLVFHQFRITFVKLFSSIEKSFAVAVSSIFAGLSTIFTMLSFIDLMIRVALVALAIMTAMMIFFPFLLLPFIGLILTVVIVISNSPFSESVGGMAEIFCFEKGTQVVTNNGNVPIESIQIGDIVQSGGVVKGVMKFQSFLHDMYQLYGINVSGTHIVYKDGQPIHVRNHPDATPNFHACDVYCLITSNHTIPIQSDSGVLIFADWEEISSNEDLLRWNKQVFETLNKVEYRPPSSANLESESVFSESTYVSTVYGPKRISEINPGDVVYDWRGNVTRVKGIVRVDGQEVTKAFMLGKRGFVIASAGAWILNDGIWQQNQENVHNHTEKRWFSLFTDSGTFCVVSEYGSHPVRDFTDLGPDSLPDTYEWVLGALRAKI